MCRAEWEGVSHTHMYPTSFAQHAIGRSGRSCLIWTHWSLLQMLDQSCSNTAKFLFPGNGRIDYNMSPGLGIQAPLPPGAPAWR